MPESIKMIVEHALPFMVAASNGKGPKLNTPRIIEAVVIAAILGGGAWMFLIPKLELEFQYMKRDLHNISQQQNVMQKDISQLKLDVAIDKARHSK